MSPNPNAINLIHDVDAWLLCGWLAGVCRLLLLLLLLQNCPSGSSLLTVTAHVVDMLLLCGCVFGVCVQVAAATELSVGDFITYSHSSCC
jgi:hypothetical protein